MTQLNKLLIDQKDIFLAPGCYFHPEFNHDNYHLLPVPLQHRQNQKLIQRYSLGLPDENTQMLPDAVAQNWAQLPKVAWGLGVIQSPKPLPWWGELSQYQELHSQLSHPLWQVKNTLVATPQTLLALGAWQLLTCLAPFCESYSARAKYMFSRSTQRLIDTSENVLLPWNIIEETCHYVRKNST
ncbi:type III secretion apparatus protein OrgA/MxiK [Providencia rustigianii]|uniref:Type III secretion apparatus protein OrgA/MxiK n=2 Tax=Providencia rustigianii TaxID=158850 RepID=D1P135_9GAMM|nr:MULTISPECIES: hypothetical protein [Providencia]EFB73054.1 hypothetical protein PROVRUST_05853 [Providencia rustigianii DSM 4541]MTC56857.1 hypothetical protein [Providencia rustigianii]SPY76068.1 type III secretion apparatus protein OrgA/MxiK [Providencia rustigianii]SUC25213.1 type III secretion apparatus protein OrgA/MxiK [Providencia rustigianii]SUC34038.1 type III secretion apparatus protein OrgA/MxiK [Providencia rustigianii]